MACRRCLSRCSASPAATTPRELWDLQHGEPVPLDLFDVPAEPVAVQPVGSDAAADPFVGYAVLLEPGRTMAPAPSKVLASGQVES